MVIFFRHKNERSPHSLGVHHADFNTLEKGHIWIVGDGERFIYKGTQGSRANQPEEFSLGDEKT